MATELSFYHLTRSPLEQALPKLLERVLGSGSRAVVLAGDGAQLRHLNQLLWTYDPNSFLPHGAKADGFAEEQPLYLTLEEENPNQADILVITASRMASYMEDFKRCLFLFDGGDEAQVQFARQQWGSYKDNEAVSMTYWQQDNQGKWFKQ